jgi:hypothetical protein
MTPDHQFDRTVRGWLADDVEVLPERVLDAVIADLPINPQHRRRRWGLGPIVSPRIAGLAVAVAFAVVAGLTVIRLPGGVAGPSVPSPSPSPSPPPSPSPSPSAAPSASPTVAPGYGSAPPGWPTNPPIEPTTPLPNPTGSALPADLVGREYNVYPPSIQGNQAEVLTLRAADDPHCMALYRGKSTCFTILWTPNWPEHATDPAVRGPARIVDGNLVLNFALVPYDPGCEGTTTTYVISADRATLRGIDVPPCSYPRFDAH